MAINKFWVARSATKSAAAFIVAGCICSSVTFAQVPIREGYIGVATKSDSRKAGQQFTFANLQTQKPFVTFPSGFGQQSLKVFEDDETIVLIYVAHLTGSTETFYLNKKRNRFTLIEVSTLEATVSGADFRPSVTTGTLK